MFILKNKNKHRVNILANGLFDTMFSKNLPRNHVIFVLALILVLASTAISTPQMVSAKVSTPMVLPPPILHTKVFNIFNTHVFAFNETKGTQAAKLEDDEYTLKTIIVNQGDMVVVHFYNIEGPTGDKHSFTIGGPYKIDIDVAPGQNGTATFGQITRYFPICL